MLKLPIPKVQANKPKNALIKQIKAHRDPTTHTHTLVHPICSSCAWCANCWRCVPEIQSRTLLPTDAQNFTRTWKAVIKGWHISAPLPLCVGWPEIELQGFNRRSALDAATQAPSWVSARNGYRVHETSPSLLWFYDKWSGLREGCDQVRRMGEAEEHAHASFVFFLNVGKPVKNRRSILSVDQGLKNMMDSENLHGHISR